MIGSNERNRALWRFLLSAAFLLVGIIQANAWGVKGHRVVAIIAERHLTPQAYREVHALLSQEGKTSMAEVASWADAAKLLRIPIQPSHSVRIKGGHEPYDPKTDCRRNNCVLAAIDANIEVLRNPKALINVRVMALKYLIHFIGDVHMPMHGTRAGRGLKVLLWGREVALHKVWDTYIISTQQGGVHEIASRVERMATTYRKDKSTAVDWALESRDITRDLILTGPLAGAAATVSLPRSYAADNWPVVQERLNVAGRRLAEMLNEVLSYDHK